LGLILFFAVQGDQELLPVCIYIRALQDTDLGVFFGRGFAATAISFVGRAIYKVSLKKETVRKKMIVIIIKEK
jgi:hypothetical protein